MDRIEFEVVSRTDSRMITTVRACIKSPFRSIALYLDRESGEVLYPVRIESITPVTIVLDSDTDLSCSFPPSASETMIPDIVSYFDTFHDVAAAARRLIEREKQIIWKERENHVCQV